MGEKFNRKIHKGYNPIEWDNIISVQEAVEVSGRERSTLVRNIENGIFVEGIDCKKIGPIWVFDRRAIEFFYKDSVEEGIEKDVVEKLKKAGEKYSEKIKITPEINKSLTVKLNCKLYEDFIEELLIYSTKYDAPIPPEVVGYKDTNFKKYARIFISAFNIQEK